MNLPDSIHTTLLSAGYRLLGPDDASVPDGRTTAVVDSAGALWTCSTTTVLNHADMEDFYEVVDELASGRHPNVVAIHDVLTAPASDRGGPDGSSTPRDVVVVWARGAGSQSLADYRGRNSLEPAHVSAALIAAARGLVSLRSLNLSLGLDWQLEDLVIGPDGGVRILPTGLNRAPHIESETHGTTGGATDLRRIAREGQVLLSTVNADTCAELAHLLAASAFGEAPVDPGTFAALCHELVTPASPRSWAPLLPRTAVDDVLACSPGAVGAVQEPFPSRSAVSDEPPEDAAAGDDLVGRYEQIARTWREHVHNKTGEQKLRTANLLARKPVARGKRVRTREKVCWRPRPKVLAASLTVVTVMAAGAGYLPFSDSPSAGTAPTPDAPRGSQQMDLRAQADSQQPGPEGTEGSVNEAWMPPDAAAMELTENRIEVLQELMKREPEHRVGLDHEQHLASVLAPDSPAMKADLALVSQLLRDPQQEADVTARARAARTLSEEDDWAIVEVSYDLVDSEHGASAQSATLRLTLVDGSWRVTEVSDASPNEQQLPHPGGGT